jgi:SET domain
MTMLTNPAISPDYQLVSKNSIAEVRENEASGHKSLHALRTFKAGDVFSAFKAGEVMTVPTYLTVQKDDDVHITLRPVFLQYINHSCDPNAFFDTTAMEVVCLKEIRKGDEITFFYPSTEWDMTQSFICHCGAPACFHKIQGAGHLPYELLAQYRLSDYIKRKLATHTR